MVLSIIAFRYEVIMQDMLGEKLIERSIILFGIAQVLHLAALFGGLSVSLCAKAALPLWIAALVFFFVSDFRKRRQNNEDGSKSEVLSGIRKYPGYVLAFLFLVTLEIIFNCFMHAPLTTGDITGETVQTFLREDAVYTVNPMTGMPFTSGMPLRQKILGLPFLYTLLSRLTSCSSAYLIYRVIPMFTLIFAYIVYGLWARFLFPKNFKNQMIFLLFTAFVFQFGCYGSATDSSLLLFGGWRGETIRACILLPYALLCLMKKRYRGVVLCILAEACMVWTLYGAGYVLLMAAIVTLIRFFGQKYRQRLMQKFKKGAPGV